MRFSPNEPVATNRRTPVRLADNTDATGRTGKTGLAFGVGAAPAGCFVRKADGTVAAAAGQLVETSAANLPGEYEYEYTQGELAANGLGFTEVRLSGLTGAFEWVSSDVIDPGPGVARSGIAQAGGASTITLDAGASGTDNLYRWSLVRITGGPGAGQALLCTGYVGSTKVATMSRAWVTQPTNASTFDVVAVNADLASSSITVTQAPNLNALVTSRAAPGDAMTLAANSIGSATIVDGAITATEAPLLANLDTAVSSRAAPGAPMLLTGGQVTALVAAILEESVTAHAGVGGSLAEYLRDARDGGGVNVVFDGGAGQAAPQYDANGLLLAGRIRYFPDKATCDAATNGAAGAEGAVRTITIACEAVSPGLAKFYRSSSP